MTELFTCILFTLFVVNHGFRNSTEEYVKMLTDFSDADKRTLPPAGCTVPRIENLEPIRSEGVPPSSGTWTYPMYCKPGYSLIGPCRLVCRENTDGTYAFSPPTGLNMPTCVKDYAASQFQCHYLSSACPLVWDFDTDPAKPAIAISRIFCGNIMTETGSSTRKVYGFGASMFASTTPGGYYLCQYKGGIKDDLCYIVKGQRNVPVARGFDLPAITYLGDMDGYEALTGSEDPYIGKLSRKVPYFLFPPDVSPSDLVSKLREYYATCLTRAGVELMKCKTVHFLTSTMNGYDIMIAFGGTSAGASAAGLGNGIIDAFPTRPGKPCLAKPCCCDLNQPQSG